MVRESGKTRRHFLATIGAATVAGCQTKRERGTRNEEKHDNFSKPSTGSLETQKDIFQEETIEEVFQGDLDKYYVPIVFEKTENVDRSQLEGALSFVGQKLSNNNINIIAIEGDTNIPSINHKSRLKDLIIPPEGERIRKYSGLGSHYMLFADDVTEWAGLNWETDPELPETSYIDTKFSFKHIKWTLGHELAAMLGGRGVDYLDAEAGEVDTEMAEDSFQSYVLNYEDMRFVYEDIESFFESNFNLTDVDAHELQTLEQQNTPLDEEYSVLYAPNTDL